MATTTPWGPAQYAEPHGRGVIFYGTAGHGGYHVSKTLNATMPAALRLENGWYEEDCDWARVALAFPALFKPEQVAAARSSLKSYAPEAYEAFTGEVVMPGESSVRDEDIFNMENRHRMVTLAAAGSGPGRSLSDHVSDVPDGYVEVFAGRGGRLESGGYPAETAYYLVPEAEYQARKGTFVVDEARHTLVQVGR